MAGSEKISGTKISCCNHRWSEPKGFKTWLIFNLLQLLLFYSAIQKIQKRQRIREKSVSVLLKNADGFCSLQKAKNVSLWFANSANYTQKMWRWRISVGIEYSIIDSHPFWQFFRALLTGCYEQQKPIEFSSN